VTTAFSVSALAWPNLDRSDWLFSRSSDLGDLVRRMQRSGIRRFVLITRTETRDRHIIGSSDVFASETPVPGLRVVTLTVPAA
jgi:hypothetical protein